jgi:hypothetical protein
MSVQYYPTWDNLFNPGTHMTIKELIDVTGELTILGNIPA